MFRNFSIFVDVTKFLAPYCQSDNQINKALIWKAWCLLLVPGQSEGTVPPLMPYYISGFLLDVITHPCFNTLGPTQNGHHFTDDILKCIFLNENVWISIKISLKFVLKGPITNIPALLQIMGWRRPGDKPLSEPMMVILMTHICITRPQWVNFNGSLIKLPLKLVMDK